MGDTRVTQPARAQVLGNPMGLVSNISQGVTGFMDHTGSGLRDLRHGQLGAMGKDLALGAASLAAGTVQGVFGSASSLSHAMVKGMAQLTFDGDYKRARALMDQERPSHLAQGLFQGGKYLGRGVLQGVTGILMQPVKGFSKGGARGAIKGVGKGLVGLVVKPVAGLVDMVAYTSEGIRNTPEFMSKRAAVVRVRLPRIWAPGSAVRAFDRRAALGIELFQRLCAQEGWPVHVPGSRAAREHEHVCEHAAWVDSVLGPLTMLLTNRRLILCEQRPALVRNRTGPGLPRLGLLLSVRLENIAQVRTQGLKIGVLARSSSSSSGGGGKTRWQALSLQTCFGRQAAGGGLVLRRKAEGEVLVELTVPDAGLREWLVKILRLASATVASELGGDDWLMVPAPGACGVTGVLNALVFFFFLVFRFFCGA